MYHRRDGGWFRYLDFILVDLLCVILSFFAAYVIRYQNPGAFLSDRINQTLLTMYTLAHLLLAICYGAYNNILRRSKPEEFKMSVLHSVLIFCIIAVYLFTAQQSSTYSRSVVGITMILGGPAIYLGRLLRKRSVRKHSGRHRSELYVITTTERADRILQKLSKSENEDFNISGIVLLDDNSISEYHGIPAITGDWRDYMLSHTVDEVMIDIDDRYSTAETVEYVNMLGAVAHIPMDIDKIIAPCRIVHQEYGFPVVSATLNSATPRQRIIKRTTDIFFGLIGTIATAVLTVFIGPLIWLEDRGPVFFAQNRVGRNGRIFKILKFRSMYTNAEQRKAELMAQNEMSGNMFKMKNDPRITKIGRFLRRTSLDELPQSINILRGEMSVVGTRPPTVDEYNHYEAKDKVRLGITPGLTGMWQVSGRSEITDFDEIVRLDKKYIQEWRLLLDLKIILKTFIVVFRRDGAE